MVTTISKAQILLCIVALIVCLSTTGSDASPLPFSDGLDPRLSKAIPVRRAECSFVGNSDVYGLGIRLGVYLQWLVSHIANRSYYARGSIGNLLDTNAIFLSALLVATSLLSMRKDETYAVEITISLYLMWGTLGSVFTIRGYRTILAPKDKLHKPFSRLGAHTRAILSLATSSLSIWFWFAGAKSLKATSCVPYIFFFARVHLLGWARIIYQIASVASAFYSGWYILLNFPSLVVATVNVCSSLIADFHYVVSHLRVKKPRRSTMPVSTAMKLWWYAWSVDTFSESRQYSVPNYTDEKLLKSFPGRSLIDRVQYRMLQLTLLLDPYAHSISQFLQPHGSYFTPFWMIWSLIAIELTLSWNGVTGVYDIDSTGQLIPFITGILSLVGLLQATVTTYLKETYRSPIGYESVYLRFNDTKRRGRLVFKIDYSLRRRHSFELARSIDEENHNTSSDGAKPKPPNRLNRALEQLKETTTFFPPERAERRYWHTLPDPGPDVLLTRSDPLMNVISIAESISHWEDSCIHEPWFINAILPARKDIVLNLWLSVKLKDPGFHELYLGQITCIRMALEKLPRFGLEDYPEWLDIKEYLENTLESRLGPDWETWDRPWPQERVSRKENKRRARETAETLAFSPISRLSSCSPLP
ncbi:hypothetical protein K505DRAFT_339041 [Melanomma pulvis-pyrius CBS 109.77]|uniref:Integral membrane protein n=1 Tax=Melanomma pulvis-pyrius CBS 109.77 TaxID=1314802 RepID=A0A6A6X6Z9_9PLEO|nr:hypothetical protein K505DRAFT_339041 [Melanomma pulvis-pyrius CBS 109.77]